MKIKQILTTYTFGLLSYNYDNVIMAGADTEHGFLGGLTYWWKILTKIMKRAKIVQV
jgi:hypothetical protein